jgi:hypothetical protein
MLSVAIGVFQGWTLEPERTGFPRYVTFISKGRPDCQAKYPDFPHICLPEAENITLLGWLAPEPQGLPQGLLGRKAYG